MSSSETTIDLDREEIRQRANKAMSDEPANDFIKGWQSAWRELLRVMDSQDAMREST